MTATPIPDLDQAWRDHAIQAAAVREVAEDLDSVLKQAIRSLKAYRLHKTRTTTPESCDYGLLVDLMLEMEKTIQNPRC
ncbi:hypothetical protein SynMEDNS5_01564 [Synechococcus sp. MEDNS5]|uniref:hypothetical protein n=1 Tax=Synechococcus sp. MEDNS5 TaxID=1442554 RepID=UPI0016479A0D|nr:hypothetical protein [Synechococcus sp. MEDNS5]QNJ06283.1 hypothetical protein SynMEDNS5_01564 [Synechococcus sp. MEDNS5]